MGAPVLWYLLATLTLVCLITAELPSNTYEIDLVFPRADGKYAETDDGLPILISVHNPDTAYHYGFGFWWDVYKQPHRSDFENHFPRFLIGANLGNDTTFPENVHLTADTTDRLEAGKYTFHWVLRGGPYCEFLPGSAEYDNCIPISNGSFEFTVESGAPTPTFTGTCPTALGMAGYASTTMYRGLPWDEEHGDPATQTLSCGITANVTTTRCSGAGDEHFKQISLGHFCNCICVGDGIVKH